MNYGTTPGSRGICPVGWHIPQDYEIKVLEGTVDGTNAVGDSEWNETGYRGSDAGSNLKTIGGWNTGANSDMYGFSIKPGGYYNHSSEDFNGVGDYAGIWSSNIEISLGFRVKE